MSQPSVKNARRESTGSALRRRRAIDIDRLSMLEQSVEHKRDTDEEEHNGLQLIHPSRQEIRWLLQAVSKNPLFAKLVKIEKKHIVSQMHKEDIFRGDVLIREGDRGNMFYVIRSGQFRVTSEEKGHIRYVGTREAVGELALIYNAPRSVTVTAMTNAIVWAIDRTTLRKHIKELSVNRNSRVVSFLKKMPLLQTLVTHEVHRVAGSCIIQDFSPGEVIINYGDSVDKFYIIKTGRIQVYEGAQREKVQRTLSKGAYFGAKALLSKGPSTSTLVSKRHSICYSMTGRQFNLLLGPLTDMMDRNMNDLYQEAEDRVSEIEEVIRRSKTLFNRMQSWKKTDIITDDLDKLKRIGRIGVGGSAVVTLVRDPNTKQVFALKSMRKDLIVYHKTTKQIQSELKVMRQLDNPFVVNLHRTYQDRINVYFLCDIGMGGDLFHYLHAVDHLTKAQITFYSGCMVEALGHIHSFGIVYRDIKPENVVICENGYLKLADFGFAKFLDDDLTFTLCGTPDYLAPEAILGRGYDTAVDWWGLGILIYEMIAHVPPFAGSPKQICGKILTEAPRFDHRFSESAKDLITKLCAKNPHKRLRNANVVREHKYFVESKFDWEELRDFKLEAPDKPQLKKDDDLSNFKISLKPDPSKAVPVDNPEWAKNF